jgi:hypothetical protein
VSAGTSFVGRAREVDSLRAGLAAAAAGHGRLFLLTGEAGIGKTRLADDRQACAGRGDHGLGSVLRGRARLPSLGLIRGDADPELLRHDAGRRAASLAQPSRDRRAARRPAARSRARRRARALPLSTRSRASSGARVDAGCCSVVDDLHGPTRRRPAPLPDARLRRSRFLVVATYRTSTSSRTARAALVADIAREGISPAARGPIARGRGARGADCRRAGQRELSRPHERRTAIRSSSARRAVPETDGCQPALPGDPAASRSIRRRLGGSRPRTHPRAAAVIGRSSTSISRGATDTPRDRPRTWSTRPASRSSGAAPAPEDRLRLRTRCPRRCTSDRHARPARPPPHGGRGAEGLAADGPRRASPSYHHFQAAPAGELNGRAPSRTPSARVQSAWTCQLRTRRPLRARPHLLGDGRRRSGSAGRCSPRGRAHARRSTSQARETYLRAVAAGRSAGLDAGDDEPATCAPRSAIRVAPRPYGLPTPYAGRARSEPRRRLRRRGDRRLGLLAATPAASPMPPGTRGGDRASTRARRRPRRARRARLARCWP